MSPALDLLRICAKRSCGMRRNSVRLSHCVPPRCPVKRGAGLLTLARPPPPRRNRGVPSRSRLSSGEISNEPLRPSPHRPTSGSGSLCAGILRVAALEEVPRNEQEQSRRRKYPRLDDPEKTGFGIASERITSTVPPTCSECSSMRRITRCARHPLSFVDAPRMRQAAWLETKNAWRNGALAGRSHRT
jgi:hypothetical protein